MKLTKATQQPKGGQQTKTKDHEGTGVRYIDYAETEIDLNSLLERAMQDDMETLVLRVPCDGSTQAVMKTLDASSGILSGVFVNNSGAWVAAYTFPLGKDHYRKVTASIQALAHSNKYKIYHSLLKLMSDQIERKAINSVMEDISQQLESEAVSRRFAFRTDSS